ncbi:tyrosine-type recombinase/integrase [Mesonia sp.]|uniref:tyrosine-type recombinase/integrase n=1 Tax=Mesonia sp. TaxID=1960830 RepID=UPI003F98A381
MSNYKISILFFLQRSRINKQGKCPIRCRITYHKKRKEFSTGLHVLIENWINKRNRSKEESINDKIELIESEINSAFIKLKVSDEIFNVEDIYELFQGKPTKKESSLLEFYDIVLGKKKKLIGIEITEKTWDKFSYLRDHLHGFIRYEFKKSDYPLNKLRFNFIESFEYYLKTEKNHQQSTANKALQRFKHIVGKAVGEGYLDENPFYNHKPKRVTKEVIFLSKEELNKLENASIAQRKLDLTRDCFLFCCYTGLAYKEMSSLQERHLISNFDGNLWIQMNRDKTKKNISVPILPKALELIKKYEGQNELFILPKISNQRFNSYLKEIANIVGIDKRLTHHMARKTFASTVLLYNDVPMEVVSELLGHSSIKITQTHYGKVVQKKVSEEMIKLRDKI